MHHQLKYGGTLQHAVQMEGQLTGKIMLFHQINSSCPTWTHTLVSQEALDSICTVNKICVDLQSLYLSLECSPSHLWEQSIQDYKVHPAVNLRERMQQTLMLSDIHSTHRPSFYTSKRRISSSVLALCDQWLLEKFKYQFKLETLNSNFHPFWCIYLFIALSEKRKEIMLWLILIMTTTKK